MLTQTESHLKAENDLLGNSPVVYLILYVYDIAESRDFYERRLGLRVIEADDEAVKFDTGLVVLVLYKASDYGIDLTGRRDDASDVVFLVDDINSMRRALEERGVVFLRRRTYEIGLVTDFYDPNGHRLMLYQPSLEALTWPSAEKLRQAWRACGKGGTSLIGPSAFPIPDNAIDTEERTLDGKPLVYLFLFVPSSGEALAYYQGSLGLRMLENVHCCNPACPPDELGIAKYDGGGMLLTTHHIHRTPVVDDFGRTYSPKLTDPAHTKGIVPVFHVNNIQEMVSKLSQRGIHFPNGIVRSQIGYIAKFEAATGHTFYLYEPSAGALQWPTGLRTKQILAGL